MKYFLDTEFIENGKTIDLINIGIVGEDGSELYCVNANCDLDRANDWVKENVISKLPIRHPSYYDSPRIKEEARAWMPKTHIRDTVLSFVANCDGCRPKFWGYYADYDWVVFCQLFGTMMDLPKGYPMYCHDIKQLCDSLGNPKLPEQGKGEHNALADARWNKKAYEFLMINPSV